MTHTESVALDSALLVESSAVATPTAAERLQASRDALQAWIRVTYHPDATPRTRKRANHSSEGPRDPGWLGVLADSITDVPMATVAVRWLKRWWTRHPLRATAEFAEVAAEELIGPMARKHPWLVVAAAAAAGAMAARVRPWRWVSKDTLIASLLPTVSVASILHWITGALHRLHPDSDEPPREEAGPADAAAAQAQGQAAEPTAPAATPPREHAHPARQPQVEPALP